MSLMVLGLPVIPKNVATYNTVAASAFIFYDYFLTFGEEVELIWRSKLSWVNVLFFWIRYLTFFIRVLHLLFCSNIFGRVPVSLASCLLWEWFQVMGGQVLFLAVEILLITRVFAYYGRNKRLLACLLILLAGEVSAMITLVATTLPISHIFLNPLPPNIQVGPCLGSRMPKRFSGLWIPPLIMQGILSILVARQFIRTRMNAQTDSPPLLVVFMRDNAWAFLLIFAVSLWATLAYELTDHQGEIALSWIYSLLGFCGSHLILNLRTAAQNSDENGLTHNVSDIKFKTNPGSRISRGAGSTLADARSMDGRRDGM